jgi:hypothetical protein
VGAFSPPFASVSVYNQGLQVVSDHTLLGLWLLQESPRAIRQKAAHGARILKADTGEQICKRVMHSWLSLVFLASASVLQVS